MSKTALVSIITSFLNTEQFLEESIQSALAQTYQNWELLLVDDGSTDRSTEIAKRYVSLYPEKVRYLEHENHQNRGLSASHNFGIRQAKGTYIAFLDADDVWLPEKLENQVKILNSQPEAAMLYGASIYWYSWTGNPEDAQRDFIWDDFGVEPNRLFQPPSLLIILLRDGKIPCPISVLVRREAIEHLGGFEESFRTFTDQVFYTKICLNAPVFVSSGCWEKYRQNPNSLCADMKKQGTTYSIRIKYLNWVEQYLIDQGFKNTEVWDVLQRVLWRYRRPVARIRRILRPFVPASLRGWLRANLSVRMG
jgi:glycosyltransferase involved in cell wall biosynthesis